jgi:hypothetical protein
MRRVYQTKFHPEGNCLQACLASIFDLDLEEVPEFGIEDGWFEEFEDWCVERFGLQPIDIDIPSTGEFFTPIGLHMINGKSPRGDWNHAVVADSGDIIHDPYPEGNRVLENRKTYTVFIKVIR